MKTGKELTDEIFALVMVLNNTDDRVRIAVTSEEYLAIEQYMLKTYDYFLGRVGGTKLVVDNEPGTDKILFASDMGVSR